MNEQPGAATRSLLRSLHTYKLAGILSLTVMWLRHHRLLTVGDYQRIATLIDRAVFGDLDRIDRAA